MKQGMGMSTVISLIIGVLLLALLAYWIAGGFELGNGVKDSVWGFFNN